MPLHAHLERIVDDVVVGTLGVRHPTGALHGFAIIAAHPEDWLVFLWNVRDRCEIENEGLLGRLTP